MATMPNVVGMNVSQATATLIAAGIVPDNGLLPTGNFVNLGYFDDWPVALTWIKQAGVPPGQVTAQSPGVGVILNNAPLNPPIALTVSNFPFSVADRYSAGGYS